VSVYAGLLLRRERSCPYDSTASIASVGGVLHVGKDVRVGVEGDSYGGVAEHLGDYLRVDSFTEQLGVRKPYSFEASPKYCWVATSRRAARSIQGKQTFTRTLQTF
jgi:hypothetical protein